MTLLKFSIFLNIFILPRTIAFAGWGPKKHTSTSLFQGHYSAAIDGDRLTDDKLKTTDILSLEYIRSTLIRQEETIIFALIERSQFRQNLIVYENGGFGDLGNPPGSTPVEGEPLSFLEFMLVGTETLHCG